MIKILNKLYKKILSIITYNRQYLLIQDKHVAYLAISKVANSSIKSSMLDNKKDDYSIHQNRENIIETTGFMLLGDIFVFTYVRNPFDRLVSCYESKYHSDIIKKNNKLYFDSYYLNGFMAKDRGFWNFLFKVLIIPNIFANRHFCSQYKLIYMRGG